MSQQRAYALTDDQVAVIQRALLKFQKEVESLERDPATPPASCRAARRVLKDLKTAKTSLGTSVFEFASVDT